MAYRIGPTKYDFTTKNGQLGQQFLMFERDQAASGDVGVKTCELYDNAWKFYGPALEPLELVFRSGKKPLTAEDRKKEERRIVQAIKQQRDKRTYDKVKPATPGTVNSYLQAMTTWLNWMSDEDRGAFLQFNWTNAMNELKMAVATGQTRTIWTSDQIDRFLRFKAGPTKFNQWRAWTIGVLMLDVGIRIDEALDLTMDDVDFDNEMLDLRRKGNKLQRISVGTDAMRHLHRYQNKWIEPYRTRKDVRWHFFGTHDGRKMSQRNSLRDLKVLLKKAKIIYRDPTDPLGKRYVPDLSWHEFRHTTATMRLEDGESLHDVQKLLGHADPKTTEIYLHLSDKYLKETHEKHSPLNKINRLPKR